MAYNPAFHVYRAILNSSFYAYSAIVDSFVIVCFYAEKHYVSLSLCLFKLMFWSR